MNKVVVLLRGTSSAGKTTFSGWLQSLFFHNYECVICCADDFFTNEKGEYHFDVKKLGIAHNICQDKFAKALEKETPCVIVANTNTKPSSFNYYLDKAKEHGYTVFSLVVEKRHNNKNSHLEGCPESILERQASEIKESLKLK